MGIPVSWKYLKVLLDLLLHLIEKNKIDIYDIPIVEITDQLYGIHPCHGEGRPWNHE